jgi:hypothetical protein
VEMGRKGGLSNSERLRKIKATTGKAS